jgi:hypothetical protein
MNLQTRIDCGSPLTVNIVLRQKGWIFEKMMCRLAENLPKWDVCAQVSSDPSPTADINHFILNDSVFDESLTLPNLRRSVWITHVDRIVKLVLLKRQIDAADVGICMSRMTVRQLKEAGVSEKKLCYITPAQDGTIKPRRIVIGITSRLRPDGAKREDILIEAAGDAPFDSFQFDIIGSGWERVIPVLEKAGATVNYYPGSADGLADYSVNIERVPQFDYYLYLGFDEGSMGTLDALAAGIPTIITPQGFHLDIPDAITHRVTNALELAAVLKGIAKEKNARIRSAEQLTWDEYARKHADVWRAMLENRLEFVSKQLNNPPPGPLEMPRFSRREQWRNWRRFYLPPNGTALAVDLRRILKALLGGRLVRRLREFRKGLREHAGVNI